MFSALFSANNINTAAAIAPGPPLNPTLSAGNASITLTWSAPSSDGGSAITGYRVQYSSNSGSTWSALTDAGLPNPLSYTWSGLSNGTSYIARVLAYNSVGNGDVSANSNSATPSTVPGVPLNPSLSAGDKSITFTWSAPSSDGGSAITGYRVQYSTNGGSSWSALANAGLPSPLTYTWSGDQVIFNGNSYTARVLAYNSNGDGSVSGSSNAAVPTFAAPVLVSIQGTAGYPSTSAVGQRPFYVTFTPTACVDYSSTWVNILSPYSNDGYSISINGGLFNTGPYTSTAANQTSANVFDVYCNGYAGATWYASSYSQRYYVKIVTYNNDGYSRESSAYIYDTIGPYYQYLTNPYSSATGTFVVTGNTFVQTSAYSIPDNNTEITSLYIEGWVVITGINICTTSRNFTVYFSGNTVGTFSQSNFCGNAAPFNVSGTTHRYKFWDVINTGYDCSGAGKIRVNGGGSIGTWSTNPDQRIRVVVNIDGLTRYLSAY